MDFEVLNALIDDAGLEKKLRADASSRILDLLSSTDSSSPCEAKSMSCQTLFLGPPACWHVFGAMNNVRRREVLTIDVLLDALVFRDNPGWLVLLLSGLSVSDGFPRCCGFPWRLCARRFSPRPVDIDRTSRLLHPTSCRSCPPCTFLDHTWPSVIPYVCLCPGVEVRYWMSCLKTSMVPSLSR